MAASIALEKKCLRLVGNVYSSGGPVVANTFIKRSSTGWIPCAAGDSPEAFAISGATYAASGDNAFQYTNEDGIVIEITDSGSAAVNALAYLTSASAINSAVNGYYPIGIVQMWSPGKTGFKRVQVYFKHTQTVYST